MKSLKIKGEKIASSQKLLLQNFLTVQQIVMTRQSLTKQLNAFINGLSIIPIYGCIKIYAKEKVRLKRLGKPMHDEFDLLIGVTAIKHKLTLVIDNVKDFDRLDGINIENWFKQK